MTPTDYLHDGKELLPKAETQAERIDELRDLLDSYIDELLETSDIRLVGQKDVAALVEKVKELIDSKQLDVNPETVKLMERRLSSVDHVTGLDRRDRQTDLMKESIVNLVEAAGENYVVEARKRGFITFDVRGLKMVNDAMKDHRYGDAYLKKIAEIVKERVIPGFTQLGGKTDIHIARDGGDEFSLLLESQGFLDETLDVEEFLAEAGESLEFGEAFVENLNGREHLTRIEYMNSYIEFRLQQEKNDIINRARLEAFMAAGEDAEFRLPQDFELHFQVAPGAATFAEVIEQPDNIDFKNDIERAAESGEAIPSSIDKEQRSTFVINSLVGAIRSRADRRSYDRKSEQNKTLIDSDNERDQLLIKMISRNDVTISLAKKAQSERKERLSLEGELYEEKRLHAHAREDLKSCLTREQNQKVQKS